MKLTTKIVNALALTFLAAAPVAAQEFPERPINIVVPFNAGGGTDLLVRGFAAHFAEAVGGDVFVSNMAGGSGTVAAAALAGQRPSGYQLGYWSVTVATVQPQIKDVPYGIDSWEPICSVAASPTMLFTNKGNGIETIEDAKAAIEAEPGKYLFGSSGPGAMTHLTTVAAFEGLGVIDKIKHLPFQGSGPALQAMAAGTIQFFGDTEILMQRGDFTPLVIFADERSAAYPDVPTATEVGIAPPLNELYLWGGLFAPAETPADVVQKLSDACGTAVASDGFAAFAADTQTTLKYRDSAEFDAFYRAQYDGNTAIIEAAGL
ncbi:MULTISPECIES: tripartite tricarboxylate transporter substrate binding protein [Marivita]|uniref:Tripartite tricarboxylate transporter substrate binding protein n=1 Tax=Marivita cryptomonadis TaxID=505252 RepID=A0A9Q2PAF7_9RHOB|nr:MULTISPECIES: tripartite tricarboxylate transporter substrate binding protein [Marivita]MCR9168406.1 tripartite tricarboxylate transporter substrate binding protein [Paracoccaceae bacterium]MBM2321822.1 tripartite tricarboxylate transporter substrate binding protein [Marivita cryptomonadis]MBM2331551.1 tripartite tricarboxylate transporter substrate binding protein [Marivita cryptomonadis]MBM2341137.1 tripartite tricarboxylate transporter substrate binding protein [Marivita cryptomonadis]MB